MDTYKVIVDSGLPSGTRAIGCGCDAENTISDLTAIGDAILTPSDPSPAGRCTHCGCLAYAETELLKMERAAPSMLSALKQAELFMAGFEDCDAQEDMAALEAVRDAITKAEG